ncbi:uncharacterized protein LOC141702716 [Apium graveolens]|uniref:uncharacterized protein LOC141702716 n=1 Tax=Apium graveolens TaxID=4045 RepID=UPI003D795882
MGGKHLILSSIISFVEQINLNAESEVDELEADPGVRKNINIVALNNKERDRIRRAFLLKGPFQPKNHDFPLTPFGNKNRRFNVSWFEDHPTWLEYSIKKDVIFWFLLLQGLAFRGHDESKESKTRGNFLQLLNSLTCHNAIIESVFKNAVDNNILTAPSIQKDITNACSILKSRVIVSELEKEPFDILVDEDRDVSCKEQMAVVLRYVNKQGCVVERLIGLVHLTLVSVARTHKKIASLFINIATLTNVVGGSCKRNDMLREKRFKKVIEHIQNNEVATGRGLNQEITLPRVGDTRWGSHYGVVLNLLVVFTSVVKVLEIIENEGRLSDQRAKASDLLVIIQRFEFVFLLHLIRNVSGITNELSQALRRKDQDLVNSMDLVNSSHQLLLLDNQLENYITDVNGHSEFSEMKGISDLERMVETKKDVVYPLQQASQLPGMLLESGVSKLNAQEFFDTNWLSL